MQQAGRANGRIDRTRRGQGSSTLRRHPVAPLSCRRQPGLLAATKRARTTHISFSPSPHLLPRRRPPAETRDDDETRPRPSCRTDGSPTGRIGRGPPELRPRSTSRRCSAAPLPFGQPLPCWLGCPQASVSIVDLSPRRRPPLPSTPPPVETSVTTRRTLAILQDGWAVHGMDRSRSVALRHRVHRRRCSSAPLSRRRPLPCWLG
ncbi:hypothetical protein B0H11DRAFT_380283 [Mycena galericulata]|nr:hypothetical protein B0H11DRAFT_380283 [Mycena galericulata]